MKTLVGVALACVASILFNGAVVLQAREARALPDEQGLHLSLLRGLLRRRVWLAGIALQVLAIGTQTGALLLAPLTAVQPAEAAGLVFLLYLGSRNLGERVGRNEILAVASIVVGIAGLTVAAQGAGYQTSILRTSRIFGCRSPHSRSRLSRPTCCAGVARGAA